MKLAGLLAACLVVGGGIVSGCAADSPAEVTDDDAGATTPLDASTAHDSAAPPPKQDAAPPPAQDAGACVPQCTSDQDCQNSCPAVSSGINCCDTQTGACYTAAQSTCPAPQTDDAGTGPY